jgi:hypothetical protein
MQKESIKSIIAIKSYNNSLSSHFLSLQSLRFSFIFYSSIQIDKNNRKLFFISDSKNTNFVGLNNARRLMYHKHGINPSVTPHVIM